MNCNVFLNDTGNLLVKTTSNKMNGHADLVKRTTLIFKCHSLNKLSNAQFNNFTRIPKFCLICIPYVNIDNHEE